MATQLPADESYAVEKISVPANVTLEVSGLDYGADGTLFICTRHGDVWCLKDGRWTHFAWGLHEPLGLCVGKQKGQVFVSQRPEITELLDTDGDGVADQYNTLSDTFSFVHSFHQYAYGLVMDKEGNLCGVLSCTGLTNSQGQAASSSGFSNEPFRMWSFKVTPGGEFKPWSSGLRTANGIGKNLAGDLFSADNQGDWVGTSMLHHLTEGAFHGNAKALRWDKNFKHRDDPEKAPLAELDKLRKMPAVCFPHGELSNSPGAPVCDTTGGKFGPFAGQMFIGDVTQRSLIRVAMEKVKGEYQGACFPFIRGAAIKAGICRLVFLPDGDLIVGRVGEGDWARGVPGQGLERIRFSGKTPFEIHSIELVRNGFVLHLTKEVDPAVAVQKNLYKITSYFYKYHAEYGSPKTDLKEVAIADVVVANDRKRVFLKLNGIETRRIYEFNIPGLRGKDGEVLRNAIGYYTLNNLSDTQFDAAAAGASSEPQQTGSPKRAFFPYVASIHDSAKRSLDEQAALYRELGFDGVGELAQELGFGGGGHPQGATIAQRVASLEKQGLRLVLATANIRLGAPQPIDLAKIEQAMPALAKTGTILGVLLGGDRNADLDAKAVGILNQIADIAKPHGVQIAIYPHAGDYAQTVAEATRIAEKVNRPQQVGVIFNLFHWMLVDRTRDLKTALTAARPWLKVVQINGSSDRQATVLPLDQGDFDVQKVIDVLDEIDYRGPVGLFSYSIPGDARIHLTSSISKWRSLAAQGAPSSTRPPENAIVLFDGKDTSQWMPYGDMRIPTDEQIKSAAPAHYRIVDGALEVTNPGHLVTKRRFNDFRLHAEVWLPGEDGINSGIWTHFRYGLEIRGRAETDPKYRLGAVYGIKPPDQDASKPAGEWQTLDITFRNARFDQQGKKTENARITVLLNGVKVQDNYELAGISPTLIEPEGPSPGPIVLENHSAKAPVRFRNIWIVPQ